MAKPDMIDLTATSALPTNLSGGDNGIRPLSAIKTIGIHWWGTPTIADEMRQLRDGSHYHAFVRDWNPRTPGITHARRLTYTYAIGQSGRIYLINPENRSTWHLNDGNWEALGINHMIGMGQRPSAAMLKSSRVLLDWLCNERSDIPAGRGDVWGHGECGGQYGGGPRYNASTSCPGPDLLAHARAYRKAQPAPEPLPTPQPPPTTHTFYPETGFSVGYAIREAYLALGGPHGKPGEFAIGFPVSEEFLAKIPDGGDKLYTIQVFERAVAHWRSGESVGWLRTGDMIRSIFERQGFLFSLE